MGRQGGGKEGRGGEEGRREGAGGRNSFTKRSNKVLNISSVLS